MINKEERERLTKYKRDSTQFSSRGKALCFLMMNVWMLPGSIISMYYWDIVVGIKYPFVIQLLFFASIVVAFLLEKSFYEFSSKFRYYLLSFSCVTFLLNALFLINVYLFFVGVIIAPLNALYFVHKCEKLNSKIMQTKV
ncbi:hypothetical protein [Photobacterium profundum]|uniref:hypothetical protein n=1 Tax=Photobacterium profundum TaxID=74109 RepID=UPI003D0ACFC1